MITVIWYDEGLCEAVVGSPRSLHKLLRMLDKNKSEFKVFTNGNYVTHKDFSWGYFEFWIAKDADFKN